MTTGVTTAQAARIAVIAADLDHRCDTRYMLGATLIQANQVKADLIQAVTQYLQGEAAVADVQQMLQATRAFLWGNNLPQMLAQSIYRADATTFDEVDERILAYCIEMNTPGSLFASPTAIVVKRERAAGETTPQSTGEQETRRLRLVYEYLITYGVERQLIAHQLMLSTPFLTPRQGITPTGALLVELARSHFADVLAAHNLIKQRYNWSHTPNVLALLLAQTPPLLEAAWGIVADAPVYTGSNSDYIIFTAVLAAEPARAVPWLRALIGPTGGRHPGMRLAGLRALVAYDRTAAIDLAVLAARDKGATQSAYGQWRGGEVWRTFGLDTAYQFDPDRYHALVEECALDAHTTFASHAVDLLIQADTAQGTPSLRAVVERGESSPATQALAELTRREWAERDDYLLAQLTHAKAPVREMAARWIERQGERFAARLRDALADRDSTVRKRVAQMLGRIAGPQAKSLLVEQLIVEKKPAICEALQQALQTAQERATLPQQARALIAEAEVELARKKKFGADWFDLETAPPLRWRTEPDAAPIPPLVIHYLFYRCSHAQYASDHPLDRRMREIVATFIDTATAGDFALALVGGWMANKARSKDSWVLLLAGALGDERLIPILRRVAEKRSKSASTVAAKALSALALLGGGHDELALFTLDDLGLALPTLAARDKAQAIFANVAQQRGVDAAELADSSMPTLGFDALGERTFAYGGAADRRFVAKLGAGGALSLTEVTEAATGKAIKSLPTTRASDDAEATTAARGAYRDLKQRLKRMRSALARRLERALVTQHTWEMDRWRTLYLAHPLLRPADCTLAWGILADDGQGYRLIFRPLEDGTFTSVNDEPVTLLDTGGVRLVHPAELSEAQEVAWRQHLADYEVTQACAQFSRPVVRLGATTDGEGRRVRWLRDGIAGYVIDLGKHGPLLTNMGWLSRNWHAAGEGIDTGGSGYIFLKALGCEPLAPERAVLLLSDIPIRIGAASQTIVPLVTGLAFARDLSAVPSEYGMPRSGLQMTLTEHDERLIPLSELSPILLSEIADEARRIAETGEYNADWRQQV